MIVAIDVNELRLVLDRFRLVPTRANRQPAVALYLNDDAGWHRAYAVLVLSVRRGRVTSLVRFGRAALFPAFGLPAELSAAPADA